MTFKESNNYNQDECIICFEKHTKDSPLFNFKNIETIITSCKCNYKCHIACIHKWIIQNPVCLMCNKPVIIMPNITNLCIKNTASSLALPLLPENNIRIQPSPPPPYESIRNYTTPTGSLSNQLSNNSERTSPEENGLDTQDEIQVYTEDRNNNLVIHIANNNAVILGSTSDDDTSSQDGNNKDIQDVTDSNSCKCCCVFLTIVTFIIIIHHSL